MCFNIEMQFVILKIPILPDVSFKAAQSLNFWVILWYEEFSYWCKCHFIQNNFGKLELRYE